MIQWTLPEIFHHLIIFLFFSKNLGFNFFFSSFRDFNVTLEIIETPFSKHLNWNYSWQLDKLFKIFLLFLFRVNVVCQKHTTEWNCEICLLILQQKGKKFSVLAAILHWNVFFVRKKWKSQQNQRFGPCLLNTTFLMSKQTLNFHPRAKHPEREIIVNICQNIC